MESLGAGKWLLGKDLQSGGNINNIFDVNEIIENNSNGIGERVQSSLELSRPSDRQLFAQAIRKGWSVPDDLKQTVIADCKRALAIAIANDSARDVAGLARVLAAIDEIDQRDIHLADKNARIDAGLATEVMLVKNDII